MDKALRDLMKLKDIYSEHKEVTVGKDLKVTLKILSSLEETETHSYAMNYDEGLAYVYSVKRETICRSIIAINGTKIPEAVETDETDDSGSKLTIARNIWIRDKIVSGWSQQLIDTVWLGYSELIAKQEDQMEITKEQPKNNE